MGEAAGLQIDWAFVGWGLGSAALAFAVGFLLGWHHEALHVFFRFSTFAFVWAVASTPLVYRLFLPGRHTLAATVSFLVPFAAAWMGASVAEMISPWERPVVDPRDEHPYRYHVYDSLEKGMDRWRLEIAPHLHDEQHEQLDEEPRRTEAPDRGRAA